MVLPNPCRCMLINAQPLIFDLPINDRLFGFLFRASSLSLLPSEKGNCEDRSGPFETIFASIFEAPSPPGEGRARRIGLAQTVSVRGEAFHRSFLSFPSDYCTQDNCSACLPAKSGRTLYTDSQILFGLVLLYALITSP